MKKTLLVSVLIFVVLLSDACKSKAPPRATEVQPGSTSTPVTTQPASTTVPPVSQPTPAEASPVSSKPPSTEASTASSQPVSTGTSSVQQQTGAAGTNTGNRHQSGIILDGALSYTVMKGDTLSGIARQFYKDGSCYPLIMMVSSGISDIDKIYPNMILTIPNLAVNMKDSTAKGSINRYFLQIANLEEQRGRRETAALIRNHTR
jgi:nucleoid-associated protein YgaU